MAASETAGQRLADVFRPGWSGSGPGRKGKQPLAGHQHGGLARQSVGAHRHETVVAEVERFLAEGRPHEPGPDGGARSGGRRCLVHRTSAAGAHRLGGAATVARMSLTVMWPKMPHTTTNVGGDRARAGIGDPGVGLQHLDAVQPSCPRCLPPDRNVALVHLDQPGAHCLPARVPGQGADDVPALPGVTG
jgi:hypothetical protein